MSKSIVFLCSGQGSQYYNMGKKLYETKRVFREEMLSLDEVCLREIGESVLSHIYPKEEPSRKEFDRLLFSNPALFMIQYSMSILLREKGIVPDYILGASLGEFVALAVSGILSAEEVLRMIIKFSRQIENTCDRGGMIAVIGDPDNFYFAKSLYENSEIAAINSHAHFIISGLHEGISVAEEYLNVSDIPNFRLPVLFGFHSSAIDPSAEGFSACFEGIEFGDSECEVFSCLKGGEGEPVKKDTLWDIVRKPFDIRESLRKLEEIRGKVYVDIGPSGTMANIVKYNLGKDRHEDIHCVLSPFS